MANPARRAACATKTCSTFRIRSRLPLLPEAAYFELAPDWVCEVISPSTARLDRIEKKRIYAREGVRWLWLVEPSARTLEVLERGGDLW